MSALFSRSKESGIRTALSRRWRILMFGLSVVCLAVVIAVVAAIGPWRPSDSVKLPNVRLTSDRLVAEANEAASSGDSTRAAQLARQAASADPTNQKARDLVTRLDSATSSSGGSGGNANGGNGSQGGGTSPDTGFTEAISNLAPLLPGAFEGYSLGSTEKAAGDVSISATPKTSAALATRLIWSVHDKGSVSAARSFLTATSRRLYGSDSATVVVDGAQAYFGTDDSRFATVAYTRGRYVFEVLVTANGIAPKNAQTLAISAARAFGDTRP